MGSVPCHVFMHDLKLAVKCLPVTFPEDPKLGRPVWLPAEGLGRAGGMGSRNLTIQALLWPHVALNGEGAVPGAGHRPCPGQDEAGGRLEVEDSQVPRGLLPPKGEIFVCCYVAIVEARPGQTPARPYLSWES